MKLVLTGIGGAMMLSGCAPSAATSADFGAALSVASAAETFYAAQPSANPQTVAELQRLLLAAQSAMTAWQANSGSAEQAALSAAVSALVTYEASAGIAKLG